MSEAIVSSQAQRHSNPDSNTGSGDTGPVDEVIHEYDGIEECDHRLPNWWLWLLYGSILFAAIYWFHFQVFRSGENPNAAYAVEMQKVYAAEAEKIRAAGVMNDDALLALARDQSLVARGRDVFTANCAICHGPDGAGKIGPNLTDSAWLYGGHPEQVYQTVSNGTKNGMPTWLPTLGIDKVQAVVAYVITIKNANVSGGKEPQGKVE